MDRLPVQASQEALFLEKEREIVRGGKRKKAVLGMSDPTCKAVFQGCRLYNRCQNLPAGHCVTVMQAV